MRAFHITQAAIAAMTLAVACPALADDAIAEIKARCQSRFADHGPAMVLGCVENDMDGLERLAGYADAYPQLVRRCTERFRSHGWAMVAGCAENDIDAQRQLDAIR